MRLAYRGITADASAFGARLETQQRGLFIEALKFFDIDLYGFVPFVGAGLGYGRMSAIDQVSERSATARDSVWMLSVPFGWDIRPNPASAWLVRTNLRWIPRARLDFPGTSIGVDLGGLEFDFIQLVLFPGTDLQAMTVMTSKKSADIVVLRPGDEERAAGAEARS